MKREETFESQRAKILTISHRKHLEKVGALGVQRPLCIVAEPIVETTTTTDHVDNENKSVITKIIHFQRHGEGFHNLICNMWREKDIPIDFNSSDDRLNPIVRTEFLDSPLTELGRQQCKSRRDQCSILSPELIIVSPLQRCIQTALLSFYDFHYQSKTDEESSTCRKSVPWISHEGCREELGLLMCNKRKTISEIQIDHPNIDFSEIEHDQDILWEQYGDRRETPLERCERVYDFLTDFVKNRPEKEIAIVSHSVLLFTLLNAVMDVQNEFLRSWFVTSEVRSMKVHFKTNDAYTPK